MTVTLASKTTFEGSKGFTGGTNAEVTILSQANIGSIYQMEGEISLHNLASGDAYEVREYKEIQAALGTKQFDVQTYASKQTSPVTRFHSKTLRYDYAVTMKKTAGLNRYVFYWFLRNDYAK